MAGGGEQEKARNAASNAQTVSAASTSAATDGEFLLHLLRQGINSGKNQRGVNTNSNNYMNTAMASASASAEEEAWQLADPAVAALGPSHPLHTRQIHGGNNCLHGAVNSSHYQHYGNREESNSSPSSFDPLLRPAPNPYDRWPRPPPFVNFAEQFPKPYDKPLLPFPDRSFGGTPCAGAGASARSYGPVSGPFSLPGVQEAPWMAGGAGVARESGPWPLQSALGPCVAQRLPPLLTGSDAVLAGSSEIYQPSFPAGGMRQLQKCEPRFSGNGADLFEHLRGLSGISENRFPVGRFVAPDDRDPCVGNLAVNGSRQLVGGNPFTSNLAAKANHVCVGRNDIGPIGLDPSHSGAAVAGERSNLSEACGDRYFRFGSIASHYEYEKCVPEGNAVNGIQQRDKKRFEMRSGDIILPKSDLPLKLQGEADVVRILARPSTNQRMSEGRTGLEGGVCGEDLKVRDACFSARIVDEPITKLSRETVSSLEQGICERTTWLDRGRRETAVREGTALCTSNAYYMDEGRQAADREFSVQIRKDGTQNFVHHSRCGQSDLMQKMGARNGTVQWTVANARHDRESTKESTEVDENREILEMHSLKSWDGIIHRPHDDLKKYKGSQQEWHMKKLQAEDEMQSWDLDSFSNSVGHFSSLEANKSGSCNLNDGLNKCSSSHISQPDISSCSQLRAFQLENPGSASGSRLHCAPASTTEHSHKELHGDVVLLEGKHSVTIGRAGKHRVEGRYDEIDKKDADGLFRDLPGHLKLVDDNDSEVANDNRINLISSRLCKDLDLDPHQGMLTANQHRRQWLMRPQRKEFQHRADLEILTSKFLLIYQSLIPQEEEEAKRKHLISCLEKLISREWPRAQLHLFGSCANSFGVSNSDIDVCLSIDDEQSSKPELVLKLADILQADNMRDVQALTHARVPIVKFTDPVTEISCDICINNILAVVNTKLLHDYAQIDVRLLQLAFMVKHWAKCRKINETYQGTLSSYAYVLMCIHFLQQRKPAILPCLQEMETTYQVTIGKIECAYYDEVDKLSNYGAENKETLGQLLLAFFDYWAFRHDYTNSVISVRTGGLLSKNEKDWTRRIGNERHLICIEDPFETSHDLGRGVDKHSIRVLKEEFRRAAEIMQHDPDPCVTLFKPYIPVVGIISETDPR